MIYTTVLGQYPLFSFFLYQGSAFADSNEYLNSQLDLIEERIIEVHKKYQEGMDQETRKHAFLLYADALYLRSEGIKMSPYRHFVNLIHESDIEYTEAGKAIGTVYKFPCASDNIVPNPEGQYPQRYCKLESPRLLEVAKKLRDAVKKYIDTYKDSNDRNIVNFRNRAQGMIENFDEVVIMTFEELLAEEEAEEE